MEHHGVEWNGDYPYSYDRVIRLSEIIFGMTPSDKKTEKKDRKWSVHKAIQIITELSQEIKERDKWERGIARMVDKP